MRAMILNEYGENAGFTLTDLTQPAAKAGHVVVRVAATSVNTVDTMIRQMGKDLPLSPGPARCARDGLCWHHRIRRRGRHRLCPG